MIVPLSSNGNFQGRTGLAGSERGKHSQCSQQAHQTAYVPKCSNCRTRLATREGALRHGYEAPLLLLQRLCIGWAFFSNVFPPLELGKNMIDGVIIPRLTSAQGLDLALLIHAQHDGVMRRVHVQADYIAHLVDQQRIVGQLEVLATMGAQSERPPDPADSYRFSSCDRSPNRAAGFPQSSTTKVVCALHLSRN